MTCGYALVSEAEIRMTNAAAGDFNDHLVSKRLERREFSDIEGLTDLPQLISVGSLNAHGLPSIPLGQPPETQHCSAESAYVLAVLGHKHLDVESLLQGPHHPCLVSHAADEG